MGGAWCGRERTDSARARELDRGQKQTDKEREKRKKKSESSVSVAVEDCVALSSSLLLFESALGGYVVCLSGPTVCLPFFSPHVR